MTTGPMTVRADAIGLDAATITRISDAHDEPQWLRSLRRTWWERGDATPWPTGQEEEWRRTSLEKLPRDVELLTQAPAVGCALDEDLLAAGVVFTDLHTAVREHGDLLQRYLGTVDTIPSHAKFWALAHAAWTGGIFLYVPAGVDVDRTLFARSSQLRGDVAFFPLTLVVAEAGSRVTLMDEHLSPDGQAGWFGGIVDVRAAEGAWVRYANLQRLGDATWNLGAQRVDVGKDANVTTLNAEIGSAVTKVGLDARMTGNGGVSRLLGLLASGEDQHIDINSCQDLLASTPPRTCSTCRPSTTAPGPPSTACCACSRRHGRRARTRSAATCSSRPRPAPSRSRCWRSRPTTSCAAATGRRWGRSTRCRCSTPSRVAWRPMRRSA
jgi:ABC-type transport system involved in Fe-S cluster assembly, permease component